MRSPRRGFFVDVRGKVRRYLKNERKDGPLA
jgi:hypothetical protein